MTENNNKQIYGLIGWPVKHSYSAFMHNAAFKHYGMNAEYQLFEVAPEKLEEFFKKTIFEKKIKGFNVTVPHKDNAYKYIIKVKGEIDKIAEAMGAVNTVCLEPLKGYNTDGYGFVHDLEEHGVILKGKRVALLGAGGGARAVAIALRNSGVKELLIYDVNIEKLENLVILSGKNFARGAATIEELWEVDIDILINATPIGMKSEDSLLIKKEWLRPDLFVYDLIYNPQETKLLKVAKEVGCKYANGLGMLLHQGALAFEHWTGKTAPVDVMRKALLEQIH